MSQDTPTPSGGNKQKKVPCEVYSRVTGYLRPVQNWNDGKRQEWEDRQFYSMKASGITGADS